ncbi:MAG TPA: phytanoyl-CoA dioxygenase family protein [Polyangiaceae bacterium]|jgi:ectoine hydroxylase-related dioxygenase (phytanoyl-CoA dioxygenase family)|nr:phytanoyl-CoA dioxygenase family protein [Polyangiaceae bacterium]
MLPIDRDTLDRTGYLVLPGVLDAACVARLRQAFGGPCPSGTQHVKITPDTYAYADWQALGQNAAVLAIAAHILGPSFHVRDVHGRNPLPGYGLQGLHADWPELAPGEPFMVVTALWMLDDFTPQSGATRVVPGSHRLRRSVPRALAQPHARHPDERIVTGVAGSVLVFNGHLWHSGGMNQSGGPRRAAQMVLQRGAPRAL